MQLPTLDRPGADAPAPHRNRRSRRDAARVLRRLLKAAGPDVSAYSPDSPVFQRAVPAMAGGATGGGTGGVAFVSNLPPDHFSMDPAGFEAYTERQDIPQQQQAFNGFGSGLSFRLQNVGVIALIRIFFVGTLTVGGTGAVTALPGFPYSLFQRVAFNANGQTSLISATGPGLRARRNRLFRNPAESIENTPAVGVIANGSYPVSFMVDVPVSHDMLTGIGWVLAQNPSTGLTLDIATAPQSGVFSVAAGGTVALTGNAFCTLTTFAVGQQRMGDGRAVTIVPDLTVFHGLLENDSPFNASGQVQAPLIRTAGQLVNYAFNLNNGGASEIAPSALTEIQFRYGGNRQPRVYNPPQMLLEKNQADYNGLVAVKGRTFTFLDFESDNPVRDLFVPEALVELTAQVTIPASVTVNNGAQFHYLEESLYPAV
jgi:hypothetical protein